jgi:hypothetical protein
MLEWKAHIFTLLISLGATIDQLLGAYNWNW